jgi:hypothetical protein
VELAIRSHNDETDGLGSDYFAVSFLVRSKLPLIMDPMRIRLITPHGDSITPQGFIMRIPWPELSERIRCMMTHYVSRGNITTYPTYQAVTGALYRITPDACYDLFFSIPPPKRGEGFYLEFQGLFSETGPYAVPLIQFD